MAPKTIEDRKKQALVEEASRLMEMARNNPQNTELVRKANETRVKAGIPPADSEVRIVNPEESSQSRR